MPKAREAATAPSQPTDAIVVAWHERQVGEHLARLTAAAAAPAEPDARLRTVLLTLAELTGGRHQPATAGHGPDLAVPLHRAEHLHKARHHLHTLLSDVIAAAVEAGHVRTDVPAAELATYSLHALAAAADLPATRPARTRLVELTLAALRPAHAG